MQTSHPISREEISDLVDRFYAKVRLDSDIGPIFNAAIDDWPAHLSLLKDFWSTVLLTERRYKGDPLSKHLELSLDPAHFARWLALFAETAREVMTPEHAGIIIGKSHRIAENFKAAIAYKRDEAPPSAIYRAPITKT
ncbi:MAG TPA: group III truncated hemoglobin [Acidobacteriaceae bacterium]|nr:group III truncated hemoglobin [Acidobacteriaceae bacterium]